MVLNKLHNTAIALERISEICGRLLAWLTLAMVLTTFLIVLLRYAFDLGWIAMQESVNYMHALVFMLGTAYAYKHSAHVRVDIFYLRMTAQQQAWVNILGNFILLMPMCVFIIAVSTDYVALSWKIQEGSQETGGLPFVYLLKTIIPLMAALLMLQALADSLKQYITLIKGSQR